MRRSSWRAGVLLSVLAAAVPFLAGAADRPGKADPVQTLNGKVVPLAELIAKAGGKLDADAAAHWLALVTADGKVYPLVKDAGGRMFFQDKALHNRPMRLTGRLVPGSQLFRVLSVQSVIKGVPHEVYYWCDICSIRRSEKTDCECCGGPMLLREEPLKK
jgi:hypothetical protein